jgi:hypothetical protein
LRNQLINNYSLDKISLKISGKLSKLYDNDLILENVKLYAENDNNLFRVTNIEADVLSGKFQGTGNILLEPYSINFVYALNTIDLGALSTMLPKSLPSLNGRGSFSGNFSTNGSSLQNQLYNLTTQSQFVINNIKTNGFSIDSFVKKINTPSYNAQNLDSDLNIVISNGQDNIKNITGNIDLQKGIVLIKNLNFSTAYTTGTASIAMNIYNFNIDSSAILSFYVLNSAGSSSAEGNKNIATNLIIKTQGNIVDLKKSFDGSALKKIFPSEAEQKKPVDTAIDSDNS